MSQDPALGRPEPPASPEPDSVTPETAVATRRRRNLSPWNLLLVLPLIGTLVPVWYNRATPELGGIPFFYWYQLVWVPVAVVLTVVVYRATRGQR